MIYYYAVFLILLLTILDLPRIVDAPDPVVTAVVNDTVELACHAHVKNDLLDLAYIWLLNGLRIDMEKQPQFSVVSILLTNSLKSLILICISIC